MNSIYTVYNWKLKYSPSEKRKAKCTVRYLTEDSLQCLELVKINKTQNISTF